MEVRGQFHDMITVYPNWSGRSGKENTYDIGRSQTSVIQASCYKD
jgi:hypothetical protein